MFGRRSPQALAELATLTSECSPPERAGVARVMGEVLDAELSREERGVAEDIVRILCADVVQTVRVALSQSVASSPNLPASVARRLALDIEEVSIPMLEFSSVVTDDVLKEVIGKSSPRQVEATARRVRISEVVSEAIVERGHVAAITQLVGNVGAELSAETWQAAIARHGDEDSLVQAALQRGSMPEDVACKLLRVAEAHVRSFIVRYLNVPPSSIPATPKIEIQLGAKRRVQPVVPDGVDPAPHAEALHRAGTLDRQTLLQALCSGEFVFLAAALARLADMPFLDVQRQLFSSSDRARVEVLKRAGIEPGLYGVFQTLLGMGNLSDRAEYQRVALEKVEAALQRTAAESAPQPLLA